MAQLIVLEEDGPLGPKGLQVWVDDPEPEKTPPKKRAPSKKAAEDDES